MQHTLPQRWRTQLKKPPRPIATRVPAHTASAERSHALALELAYRPGGLLAAKLHLKHISVAVASQRRWAYHSTRHY